MPKPISKWQGLGERIARLKDGESLVLECDGDPNREVSKIRSGLNGIRVCCLVQRRVKVLDGKIVITRVGNWPLLSSFKHAAISMPADARDELKTGNPGNRAES